MEEKRNVYIVGHRNPDTDSICSAIAYADLKNRDGGSYHYTPTRAGQISSETEFVLDYFGMEQPLYLNNLGTRVKEMEIRHTPPIKRSLSLRKAWQLMGDVKCVTLPIVNDENILEGLITIQDIATSYMQELSSSILSDAKTPYKNIVETLDAKMIVGDINACFDKGKVIIAAANPDVMEDYIGKGDMVILGNRYESQLSAIEMEAGCIVVCLDSPVSKSIRNLAKANNCTVIVSPLDTYTVARLLNQSMTVEYFMTTENLVTFDPYDYTESVKSVMSTRRFRDFPVTDKSGHYIGMISRRNLLGVKKRAVILVDHNEVSQAVDNIENADILEIIDHHRLGSIQTIEPVYFRNEPVGCTATIIWQIYKEKRYDIPKNIAGLLCSAILSDTLLFRSPTCTALDKAACEELSQIAGIDCEKFAIEMFTAGSNLKQKTAEEIFYQDYKKFEFGEISFGVGQISSMNENELKEIKKKLTPMLEKVCKERELDMAFFMLTDILKERSELLCYGNDADEFVFEAFGRRTENGSIILDNVVSRKKQLIPAFMNAINKEDTLA
ncbi:MAG: putative manganese-dependent inorganic diphosphatase [Acutalibacteraceae bacterium]|nr:putative manganese-dependent inorganic diphosphatase [Oscillospiraceae bacterium]